MMNDLDERGRAAAATLRSSMDDGFDVDAALAAVRREESIVAVDDLLGRPRRGWMVLSAAAAVAAVALVGTVLLRSSDDAEVNDVPSVATTEVVTTPSTSPSDSTVAPDETSVTTTGAENGDTTTSLAPLVRTVVVDDVVQPVTPDRHVLATFGIGSGAGELAIEDCQECDPARPWAPIRVPYAPNGQILVADEANARWVMFEPVSDTQVRTVESPWPSGVVVSAQPVVDDAGTIYAVVSGPLGTGGATAGELWVYDPADLSAPIGRYPASGVFNSPPLLRPGSVILDGAPVEGLGATVAPRPGLVVDGASSVVLQQDASQVTFVYPPDTTPQPYGSLAGLPDGSGLVQVRSGELDVIDRLFPDGRVARVQLPPAASQVGAAFAAADGFVRLEFDAAASSWQLVEYSLPQLVSYTTPRAPGDRAAAVFAAVPARPDVAQWVDSAAAALGDEYRADCADPDVADPSSAYEQLPGSTQAVFELRVMCDDTFGGYRWVVDLGTGPDGVRPMTITEQTICIRGVTTDGADELCV
jgi:hypothetical protein